MRLRATLLAAAALLAGCASDGATSSSRGSSSASSDSSSAAVGPGPSSLPAAGMQAGWMDPRSPRQGQTTSLTLVSAGSRAGQLISKGKASMPGGKVIDDELAARILQEFEDAGFSRFAVVARPDAAPSNALGVIWIDRGRGVESLFLFPGARQDPRTRDLPDVYEKLKGTILVTHQMTPGSMVTSGAGWAGDEMTNQKVERPKR